MTATTLVTITDMPIAGLVATNNGPTTLGSTTLLTASLGTGSNVSYAWNFGDGATGAGSSVSHVYPSAGYYTAVVTATNAGSMLIASTAVTVTNAAPVASAGPAQIVKVSSPVTLDGSGSYDPDGHLPLSYGWQQTGGSAVALSGNTTSRPTFMAPPIADVLTFTLIVTDGRGLVGSSSPVMVTVTDRPILGLSASNGGLTALGRETEFTASVITGSNVLFAWSFGDGSTGAGATVAHTYAAVGVYTATVTATNSVSMAVASTTVVVEALISGLVAINDSPTPIGSATHLTATIDGGSHVAFAWDFGDGGLGAGAAVSHAYAAVGTYTATVTATNVLGAVFTRTVVTITEAPIAGLTALNSSPTRLGAATVFTASIAAGTAVSYLWDFGNGATAGGKIVTHTYALVGSYTAVVTASNDVSTITATTVVAVVDRAIMGLTARNSSPNLLGISTAFTATITGGSNEGYAWSFGDGGTGGGSTVTHTYAATGLYTARVTATNTVSTVVATTAVTIADVPVAGLAAFDSSPGLLGDSIAFSATVAAGSNVSYTWNFGDPVFRPAVNYGVSSYPPVVVQGDFNLDGKPDLVVMNLRSYTLRLGNGDGTFGPRLDFTTDFRPASATTGDFNADGKLDLVAVSAGDVSPWNGIAHVLLGNGDGTFQAAQSFAAGSGTMWVAVGDLNNDGRMDLVTANPGNYPSYSYSVGVLLGNGDGTFQSVQTFAAGNAPYSVAIADVSGDGKLDLVVANNHYNGSANVLLGNGDGTFAPAVGYAAGKFQRSVALGDFNGDGRRDIATTSDSDNSVSVWLGNGDGSFGSAAKYAVGSAPRSVTAADFTIDGKLDLIVPNYNGGSVSLLVGNGDGTFQGRLDYATGQQPIYLAVGDFNLDGRTDLATANYGSANVSVLLGNLVEQMTERGSTASHVYGSIGSYVATVVAANSVSVLTATVAVTVADRPIVGLTAYNDGPTAFGNVTILRATVADGSNVAYSWSLGDGSLGVGAQITHTYPAAVLYTATVTATNSVNSLTASTIVTVSAEAPIHGMAASNNSPTLLGEATAFGVTIAAGDNVSYTWDFGDGAFRTAVNYSLIDRTASYNPRAVAMADLNADGYPDLAMGTAYGLSVLLGRSDGTFNPPIHRIMTIGYYSSIAVGDFGGDGKLDVALGDSRYSNNRVVVLPGKGDGTFGPEAGFGVGSGPQSLVAADFDGDGKLDLAAAIYGTGSLDVLLGRGDGTFEAAVSYGVGGNTGSVAVGDFNRDGITDLVAAVLSMPSGARVLLGNGDGTFRLTAQPQAGSRPEAVAVGDFDGDGKLDLVLADSTYNKVYALLGNGDGTFRTAVGYNVGRAPKFVATGDFDGDGRSDVVAANSNSNDVSVLLSDGRGGFQPALTYAVGSTPESVAIGDLDADGRSDLAVGNSYSSYVSVLSGTGVDPTGGGQMPSHTYTRAGVYTATVTGVNDTSTAQASTVVNIVDRPIAGLSVAGNSPTRLALASAFTATVIGGTGVSYVWDFGDGARDTGPRVAHVYPAIGRYTATVTATNGVGSAVVTAPVTILDWPVLGLAAINNGPTRLASATGFTATVVSGTNVSYVWSFGDGATGSGRIVTHTYPAVGSYTATVTATNSLSLEGSPAIANTPVTIIDRVIVDLKLASSPPYYFEWPTTFTATVAGGSNIIYHWNFGDGSPVVHVGGPSSVISYTHPDIGVYTIRLTATNGVSSVVATKPITVVFPPIRHVSTTGDDSGDCYRRTDSCATITYAIRQAIEGDTIKLAAGIYSQAGTIVDKNVAIAGMGAGSTVVQASPGAGDRVFYVPGGVTATIRDLTVRNGNGNGGAIRNDGSLTVSYAAITGNAAPYDGAGIYNLGMLTIDSSTIAGNVAHGNGGGIYNRGTLKMAGSTLRDNSAANGGAIYSTGKATVTGTTMVSNSASYEAGAVYNYGTFNMAGTAISGGNARYGGGIVNYISSTLTIDRGTIDGSVATDDSGGILSMGVANIDRSYIAFSRAGQSGGGIHNAASGVLTIRNSTIAGNEARMGGGIRSKGQLVVLNSTVGQNTASADGGGVYHENSLRGSSFSEIRSSTIASNSAGGTGGGVYNASGAFVSVNSTIVAVNIANDSINCRTEPGGITSLNQGGMNLEFPGNSCPGSSLTGYWVYGDPRLAPLGNYGGDTPTMAVQSGGVSSAAIDADWHCTSGVFWWACLVGDQRGIARPQGSGFDIGSYEFVRTGLGVLRAHVGGPTPLGSPTQLSAFVSAGSNLTYAWSFGDGAIAQGASVSHTYPALGTYTATVSATDGLSVAVASTVVRIVDSSITGLQATASSPTKLGTATMLTATVAGGTGLAYTWSFGDGGMASGAAVSHTYAALGVYTATVTATNSVNTAVATTAVVVATDVPIAGLSVSSSGLTSQGLATWFTATVSSGTGVTYTWSFGDNTPNVAGSIVSHVYSASGTYDVRVLAINSVGRAELATTVTIKPPIIFVKSGAAGASNGTSWANAFTSLQSALTAATPGFGQEIWVAAGTYKPTSGTDRSATFTLKDAVEIYGGFAGNESARGQRDWRANVTVLSGDIGVLGSKDDNSYNVVVGSGTTRRTILDGFTITLGSATDANSNSGRAVEGGGMYNDRGSPTVRNIVFSANRSKLHGGAMRNYYSNPSLYNVTFSANETEGSGGALSNHESSLEIVNAVFIGNQCLGSLCEGGAVHNRYSSLDLYNVVVSGNRGNKGGGVWNSGLSSVRARNVTFAGNYADQGSAIYDGAYGLDLVNGVVWGNTGGGSDPRLAQVRSYNTAIRDSLIPNGFGNGRLSNIINADPKFVRNPGAIGSGDYGDLHLSAGSPVINAGNNDFCLESDLDGNSRPGTSADRCDMGAYEYRGATVLNRVVGEKDDIGSLPLGSVVTYTISLFNNGEQAAAGVMIVDELPVGVVFEGWVEQNGGEIAGGAIVLGEQTVPVGSGKSVSFRARIGEYPALAGATIANTVRMTAENMAAVEAVSSFTVARPLTKIYLPIILNPSSP